MSCIPKYKKGWCGGTLRNTILAYSFIMIVVYLIEFLYHLNNGKYIKGGMDIYAFLLSLSLYAGAVVNRKTVFLNLFKFGFYINIIYCIILYIVKFTIAFKVLLAKDATYINSNTDDRYIDLTSNQVKLVTFIFILVISGNLWLETTYYLYGLSYIRRIKEEYEDAKEFRELENSI